MVPWPSGSGERRPRPNLIAEEEVKLPLKAHNPTLLTETKSESIAKSPIAVLADNFRNAKGQLSSPIAQDIKKIRPICASELRSMLHRN